MNDVIIIGSGPAGYTAAIYAARANLHPILLEGQLEAGGALMTTTEVENFPGFAQGIQGPDLMAEMRGQAERFGTVMHRVDATAVKFTPEVKGVKTSEGELLKARSVILATGSAHRKLGLPREDELSGRGVSYCGVCDGAFFVAKPILVVGGGDSACEEALFLSKFGSSVTMLVRGSQMRASKVMQDRVLKSDKIEVLFHAVPQTLVGSLALEAVETEIRGEMVTLEASGLFVCIGHTPRSDLFRNYIDLDEAGYAITNGHDTLTKVPGVFASGDLVDHTYRQAITAAASGARAAIDAERWLEANR